MSISLPKVYTLARVHQSKNPLLRVLFSLLGLVTLFFVVATNPSRALALSCSLSAGQCISSNCCNFVIAGATGCSGGDVCCDTLSTICVHTPIGDIPTEPGELISFVIARAIGLGGGFALLLLMFGGFTYVTSRGDSAKTKEAASIMTAAVSGLLLIVFSVVILRILGRDILGIELGL